MSVCCTSAGGIIVGYVSDLYGGRRACVIVSLLSLLCPLLYIFSQYSDVVSCVYNYHVNWPNAQTISIAALA
jgi:nitrate/nitrite transporter NarK